MSVSQRVGQMATSLLAFAAKEAVYVDLVCKQTFLSAVATPHFPWQRGPSGRER